MKTSTEALNEGHDGNRSTIYGDEDYAPLITALGEAEVAANRIVAAYDVSLARLRECRFESEAALAILIHFNRSVNAVAKTRS